MIKTILWIWNWSIRFQIQGLSILSKSHIPSLIEEHLILKSCIQWNSLLNRSKYQEFHVKVLAHRQCKLLNIEEEMNINVKNLQPNTYFLTELFMTVFPHLPQTLSIMKVYKELTTKERSNCIENSITCSTETYPHIGTLNQTTMWLSSLNQDLNQATSEELFKSVSMNTT